MKKSSFENLDDGFLNLYKEGLFVRCFEYTAKHIGQIMGYRVYLNIDKKTGFLFLELGFPMSKLDELTKQLDLQGYRFRIVEKDGSLEETFGENKITKNKQELIEIKNNLIKL